MVNKKEHRFFRYPNGHDPHTSIMHNYTRKKPKKTKAQRKRSQANAIKRRFSHNKYNAHKINYAGHKFDSKAELRYYYYLKSIHANFLVHPRFPIINHQKLTNIATNKQFKIRKHSYTPDFIILKKNIQATNKSIIHHPEWIQMVVDIKGGKASPYANLRFDLFAEKYKIPVTVVKYRRNRGMIKQTRGVRHK